MWSDLWRLLQYTVSINPLFIGINHVPLYQIVLEGLKSFCVIWHVELTRFLPRDTGSSRVLCSEGWAHTRSGRARELCDTSFKNILFKSRVAEVRGPPPKSLDSDENFKSKFVAN